MTDVGKTLFDPNPNGEPHTLESVIMMGVGAASTCWSKLDKAGIYQSEDAKEIGNQVIEWVKGRYVPELRSSSSTPDVLDNLVEAVNRLQRSTAHSDQHPEDPHGGAELEYCVDMIAAAAQVFLEQRSD